MKQDDNDADGYDYFKKRHSYIKTEDNYGSNIMIFRKDMQLLRAVT